ncbi:MAG: NAD-dependent epimerase/dehydratase family protein, partial [Nannocystaceae bacterium]
ADLLERGSFEEAVHGCSVVFHCASPFQISKIRDPQRELVDPAVQGTENVLDAVSGAASVSKVVLTSSVAAMYSDADECEATPNNLFTPDRWNERSSLTHNPYSYSKTLAERRAWELHGAQDRWSMTAINPSFILGPPLSGRGDSTSLNTIRTMTKGLMALGAPDLSFGVVDVRDVARAHMLAATSPETNGERIIVSARTMSMLEMAATIEAAYPGAYRLPTRTLPKWVVWLFGPLQGADRVFVTHNVGHTLRLDNQRSLALGLDYQSAHDTLRDQIEAMRRLRLT